MCNFNLRKRCRDYLLMGTCLLAAGVMPSSAWAEGCTPAGAQFTMLVDASSSCSALSVNMKGCVTDSTGRCEIENPGGGNNIVIQVDPSNAVGSIPTGPGLVSWKVLPGGPLAPLTGQEIDIAILPGATGGGTCAWVYTPGTGSDSGLAFEKKQAGSYQKVNNIYFCSDFGAPPLELAKMVLSKTVMLAGGDCGVDDVENLNLKVGLEVEYCFLVENIGIGDATSVILSDPDVMVDLDIGTIAAGATAQYFKSDATIIDSKGETVNVATVIGKSFDDSTTAFTDMATVNAELALVSCPPDVQASVDNFAADEGFKYAILLDPAKPGNVSECIPSSLSSQPATSVECANQCTLKAACQISLTDFACTSLVSKCEPSGNWTTASIDNMTACSVVPYVPVSGMLPNCSEAIQDRDRDCIYKNVEPLHGTSINIKLYSDNPFCYWAEKVNIDGITVYNYVCF
jgi:hypothetical protein